MRAPIAPPAGRHGGFTLLELLVAVALMGVLAVLCWRGLDTVLRSRDVIVHNNDELRALTAAFAQLDDDLRRSWTVRLLRISSRDPIRFTRASPDGPVALELLRESGSLDERLRIQQVIYRLRDGQLERGFGPWQPEGQSAPTVVALLVWFVYALQCMSTVAVMRRETGSWRWPALALTYLTLIAYAAAWLARLITLAVTT